MSWPDRLGLWWGTLEGADFETLTAAASGAGFTDISVTPAMYFAARARGRSDRELRDRLFDQGLRVAMVDPLIAGLPGAPLAATVGARWRSAFEHDESDCFRAAEALHAGAVNVAHFLGRPTPIDELIEAIGEIAARAQSRGIGILVEFMPEGSIRTLADAASLCSTVGTDRCQIMVDTWHLWRTDGDEHDLAGLDPGMIGALQVSDATPAVRGSWTNPPERDRLVPGAGGMGLHDMIAAVTTSGSSPVIGVEIFRSTWAEKSPAQVASLAHDACRALFEYPPMRQWASDGSG